MTDQAVEEMDKVKTHPLLVEIQNCMATTRKLGRDLPQDLAIPLLDIHPSKISSIRNGFLLVKLLAKGPRETPKRLRLLQRLLIVLSC